MVELATPRVAPPFSWFGGKYLLAPRIVDVLPEHMVYVEAFGGAANVLFAKEPSRLEVINDLDGGLVNFWRVLRDTEMYPRLQRLVDMTPYSEREYYACCQQQQEPDPVMRAWAWYVVIRQAHGSVVNAGGWRHSRRWTHCAHAAAWLSSNARLAAVHARLQLVQLSDVSWQRCLERYDAPATLFYLDPPYVPETRRDVSMYRVEMTHAEHEELVARLLTIRGMAALSGYDSALYRTLEEHGWRRHGWRVSIGSSTEGGREQRTNIEYLWLNPAAQRGRRHMRTTTPKEAT